MGEIVLCTNPFVPTRSRVPFGCSQCLPCRINRRRQWSMRMLLESFKHGDSSFITTTYADEGVSCSVCKGPCKRCSCKSHSISLQPADGRNWLKRFRKILEPQKIRFFMVGEYGSETQRPHFHAIAFGINPLIAGGDNGYSGLVKQSWACGHVYVGDANIDSMQYVAGYVTKKLTSDMPELAKKVPKEPRKYVDGRVAEYSRMSLRPGIGAPALDDIFKAMDTDAGLSEFINSGDVPFTLKLGSRSLPLARYLRRKLRVKMGIAPEAPKEAFNKYALQMSDVFSEAKKNPKMMAWCISRKDVWSRINAQRALNLGAKFKIFESAHKI